VLFIVIGGQKKIFIAKKIILNKKMHL